MPSTSAASAASSRPSFPAPRIFKPGDRVRCVDAKGTKFLTRGTVDTVAVHVPEGAITDYKGRKGGGLILRDCGQPSGVQTPYPFVWEIARFEAA
jgi:hypothetical protein